MELIERKKIKPKNILQMTDALEQSYNNVIYFNIANLDDSDAICALKRNCTSTDSEFSYIYELVKLPYSNALYNKIMRQSKRIVSINVEGKGTNEEKINVVYNDDTSISFANDTGLTEAMLKELKNAQKKYDKKWAIIKRVIKWILVAGVAVGGLFGIKSLKNKEKETIIDVPTIQTPALNEEEKTPTPELTATLTPTATPISENNIDGIANWISFINKTYGVEVPTDKATNIYLLSTDQIDVMGMSVSDKKIIYEDISNIQTEYLFSPQEEDPFSGIVAKTKPEEALIIKKFEDMVRDCLLGKTNNEELLRYIISIMTDENNIYSTLSHGTKLLLMSIMDTSVSSYMVINAWDTITISNEKTGEQELYYVKRYNLDGNEYRCDPLDPYVYDEEKKSMFLKFVSEDGTDTKTSIELEALGAEASGIEVGIEKELKSMLGMLDNTECYTPTDVNISLDNAVVLRKQI